MNALLDIRDYRLDFDTFDGAYKVLDGIDLSLAEGETLGIVGETGCGKSVLAKSIMGLLPSPPARVLSGSIMFEEHDLLKATAADWRAIRGQRIAMIFQDPMTFLNPVLTIGQQVCDVIAAQQGSKPKAARLDRAGIRAHATRMLELVRLPDAAELLNRYPHQLSGGMRQRVLIAMALSGSPRLLIADEPTTALDVTIQAQVLALIDDLVQRLKLAVIMISHDLGAVAAVCRRIAVMYAGTVVEDAPTAELLAQPRHPYTRGLLAALPDIDGDQATLVGIAGSIPNLLTPPQGCRFHPRCPLADGRCRSEKPLLRRLSETHRVACHHA
ncbi:ABC transporter ATP-binding protein [Ferrovibrio terrae]|uniref:ABC transporter ATP-binding protein n=1 Tax=Ferrovibrio terrae TaxID=2594003 RepID=UPI0031376FF2